MCELQQWAFSAATIILSILKYTSQVQETHFLPLRNILVVKDFINIKEKNIKSNLKINLAARLDHALNKTQSSYET
jgi:hypothetical protein